METISAKDSAHQNVVKKHPAYADCLLQTSLGTIECSKVMLATRSSFFHNIFTHKQNEGKSVNVVLIDCSFEAVKTAVDVILGLRVVVPVKNANRVKHLLNKWQVKFSADADVVGVTGTSSEEVKSTVDDGAKSIVIDKETDCKQRKRGRSEEAIKPDAVEASKESAIDLATASSEMEDGDDDSIMNWTKTSSDVDVSMFKHKVIKRHGNGFKYKCDICGEICNMYELVKKHFYKHHKDYTSVKSILQDVDFEKKIIDTSLAEIRKLVTSKNVTDRDLPSELSTLSDKNLELVGKIKSINADDLEGAPTLERKVQSSLHNLGEVEKVISSLNKLVHS